MEEVYISVDVETVGPEPGDFSMVQFGACVVGKETEDFLVDIKPINDNFMPATLELFKTTMEGLYKRGEYAPIAMFKIAAWVIEVSKGRLPVLVCYSPFDWKFVSWYFNKFLGYNPFKNGVVEIRSYYMGMMKCLWQNAVKKRMDSRFQTAKPHTHNALDDAVEQADIFKKMLDFHH
ncbi:MAG: 3'-5' exoribonuclease [Candidatus Nealsonbacteria bacterium]|nr:3'-5' exoribonuclease [Candidatus Nealsonbacteria bacterium]